MDKDHGMKTAARIVLMGWLASVSGLASPQESGQAAISSPSQDQADLPRLGDSPRRPPHLTGLLLDRPSGAGLPAAQPDGGALSVTPANREASRDFYLTYYQNAATPPQGWTGNRTACDAGTTSSAFRDAILLRINYYRAMAGAPAQVTFDGTYTAKAQQAALMMSANSALSHSPPATWSCYTADGAQAAGSSNLALGTYGWRAITAYMKDFGTNNGAVGHRRWILYPQTQNMGTGDIPPESGSAANDLWVFDSHMWEPRPPTREAFVAWPPPGYVPYQVVFPRWSFSYPSAVFSQASVTMTQGQQSIPLSLETVANGYGENTIAWIPNGLSSSSSWPQPAADTPYSVTISNVIISGSPRSFTYEVVVMDPAQDTRSAPSDFTGDLKSDILWRGTGGDLWLWPMSGTGQAGEAFVRTVSDPAWQIRSVGDQDGDGKADLLWRHAGTGALYFWRMEGGVVAADLYVGTVPIAYDIVGSGDYDGDGKTDLLWRHTTQGDLWLWRMNGATQLGEDYVGTVAPAYVLRGSGDLTGAGRADLLWQHATQGDAWAWLMNGGTRLS